MHWLEKFTGWLILGSYWLRNVVKLIRDADDLPTNLFPPTSKVYLSISHQFFIQNNIIKQSVSVSDYPHLHYLFISLLTQSYTNNLFKKSFITKVIIHTRIDLYQVFLCQYIHRNQYLLISEHLTVTFIW